MFRLSRLFRHKYVILKLPAVVYGGVFAGVLPCVVLKARIMEETDKAIRVVYDRTYVHEAPILGSTIWHRNEWLLKDDTRIVEMVR